MGISSLTSSIAAQQTFGIRALVPAPQVTATLPDDAQANTTAAAAPPPTDPVTLSAQAQQMLAAAKAANIQANTAATTQSFLSFAHATPGQRMHAQALQSLGISEQQLVTLPPDQRKAVESKVSEMIRARAG